MSEDWDNLCILDACRYDYLKEQHDFEGTVERVVSPGKRSWEFMEESFVGREFHDTIYITSNPYSTRLPSDTFFKSIYLIDEWDEKVGTIHPNDVVRAAKTAHEEHPDKRLILHFMQPHRPYLGPTAEDLRERVDLIGYRNQGDGIQIWGAVKEGKVTVAEVRKAYSESLDIVLEEVKSFHHDIGGKTVITADHGEMLGERVFPFTSRVWGHSEGFSTPFLRQVPWLVLEDSNERREITQSAPVESDKNLSDTEVQERLEALGYVE